MPEYSTSYIDYCNIYYFCSNKNNNNVYKQKISSIIESE